MKALMKLAFAAAVFAYAPLSISAASQPATAASAEAASQMSEGEIRKVDKDAKKITIKHGELKNLEMPPMTMVFQVKDPAVLEKVKPGDKVSFVAEKVGGQFTVTQIEVKQ
jgi:Cu(I)/Ag(I) efflux system periplasmic protein CusF